MTLIVGKFLEVVQIKYQAVTGFWHFPSIHVLGSPLHQKVAIEFRLYSSAHIVYLRTQARGKRKHIMRFEIRYFFLEVGLSPLGLTQPQEKSI